MTTMLPVENLPVLQLNDITLDYGSGKRAKRVLHGVSLTVGRGETLGLVGESGSGKTSIAKIVLGLQKPTSGAITFQGHDLVAANRPTRRLLSSRLQVVFQDPYSSLNPTRRIGASIAEPLSFGFPNLTRSEVAAKVADMLEKVGLPADAASRYPSQFSGGQRQRIGIARALIVSPDLVVCDEPVSALDLSVQAQILNLLAELQEQTGVSYLFIAHDLSVVQFLSHRVAVMEQGRIVETGTVEQVYGAPQSGYTQRLLNAIPNPEPV